MFCVPASAADGKARAGIGLAGFLHPKQDGEEHSYRVTVTAQNGASLIDRSGTVHLKARYLNGPNCPPPCYGALVSL